jgi:hypothetical protein
MLRSSEDTSGMGAAYTTYQGEDSIAGITSASSTSAWNSMLPRCRLSGPIT